MVDSLENKEQINADQAAPVAPGTEQASATATSSPSGATPLTAMPDLAQLVAKQINGSNSSIDLLKDVELNVKIELGRTKMFVEDVLKLSEGAVVELDKLAGDPVDILVNEKLVARGEVLVLNDNFCVRINQIVADSV
jgi:flagellar motor switch protein FliN/FliY